MKSFKPEKSASGDGKENCSQQTRTYNLIINDAAGNNDNITLEASIPTISFRDFARACFSLDDVQNLVDEPLSSEQVVTHFRQHGFFRLET